MAGNLRIYIVPYILGSIHVSGTCIGRTGRADTRVLCNYELCSASTHDTCDTGGGMHALHAMHA